MINLHADCLEVIHADIKYMLEESFKRVDGSDAYETGLYDGYIDALNAIDKRLYELDQMLSDEENT